MTATEALATMTIRDLDDAVKARLRVWAAQNGRSMEAEARAILEAAVPPPRPEKGLGTRIRSRVLAAGGGYDLEIPPRGGPLDDWRPVDVGGHG